MESRTSEHNDELYVVLHRGRIQLCTANAIYSYEERYDNFAEIFTNHIDLEMFRKGEMLLLGLGLGSVPYILDLLKPGFWDIVAVEIDEEVCSLATKYTIPKLQSRLQTIIADAEHFVSVDTAHYDLICVDLFIDDRIPVQFQDVKFLETLSDRLTKDGLIIFNTLAYTESDKNESMSFFKNTFLKVFPKGYLVDAHKNFMLISQPHARSTEN